MKKSVTKEQELIKLGYAKKWLKGMQIPAYSHVRFSLDELILLESLRGKSITICTTYSNFVKEKVVFVKDLSVGVIAASILGDTMISCINKQSLFDYIKTNILTINKSHWNYNHDGTISPTCNK